MSSFSADNGDLRPDRRRDPADGEVSDREEIDSVQRDGEETWRKVFRDAEPGLRRFLQSKLPQSADAEDCLQAVMLAALKNQTDVPPPARTAWLFRVAANEAALWWRKKSTTDRVMERHAESLPEEYSGESRTQPIPQIEIEETREQVRQAIESLPENAKQVVRLRLQDGITFQQIADRLELPLGTVLTRMRRAMRQLREILDDHHNERQ